MNIHSGAAVLPNHKQAQALPEQISAPKQDELQNNINFVESSSALDGSQQLKNDPKHDKLEANQPLEISESQQNPAENKQIDIVQGSIPEDAQDGFEETEMQLLSDIRVEEVVLETGELISDFVAQETQTNQESGDPQYNTGILKGQLKQSIFKECSERARKYPEEIVKMSESEINDQIKNSNTKSKDKSPEFDNQQIRQVEQNQDSQKKELCLENSKQVDADTHHKINKNGETSLKGIEEEACDVQTLKRQHIKELVRRKRLQAKDDFGRVDLRKSMEDQRIARDDLIHDNLTEIIGGQIAGNDFNQNSKLFRNSKGNRRERNTSRVRKMSETPPKRNRQNELKNNLIVDEEIEELEVNHSLRVLQANLRSLQVGFTPRKKEQPANEMLTSPHFRNRLNSQNHDQLNWNKTNKLGQDSQNLILNPKDSIFRKLSNYGSNGYDGVDGQSVTEIIERPDITKAQRCNQSDKDEGEDDDDNDLVSLEDLDLDKLNSFNYKSDISVSQLQKNLVKAIEFAEKLDDINNNQAQPLLAEDYESLIFGQSIWSTEVQKESKQQFLSNLQQMQSSEKFNENTSDIKKLKKQTNESDQENEFDILQKKIHQETFGTSQKQMVQQSNPDQQNSLQNTIQNKNTTTSSDVQHVSAIISQKQHCKSIYENSGGNSSQQIPIQNQQLQQQSYPNNQLESQTVNCLPQPNCNQNTSLQHQAQQHYQASQQNIYHSNQQQFNQNQTQSNQFDIQGTTGAQPVGDLSQGPLYQQKTDDYGTQFQQKHQDFTSATGVNVNNNPSVHSGQVQFGAPAGSGSAVGIFEVGPEYHCDQSSNYCPSTHHPFSMIGNPHDQSSQQHPALQDYNNHYGENNQHTNHNNQQQQQVHNQNQYGKSNNNKYHIMINRHMSRYMMGPIFKSKNHGPVMMHRLSGVPWRGGQHNISAAIIAPHGPSGFMDNMDHMGMQHQQHIVGQGIGAPQLNQMNNHTQQFTNQTSGIINNQMNQLNQNDLGIINQIQQSDSQIILGQNNINNGSNQLHQSNIIDQKSQNMNYGQVKLNPSTSVSYQHNNQEYQNSIFDTSQNLQVNPSGYGQKNEGSFLKNQTPQHDQKISYNQADYKLNQFTSNNIEQLNFEQANTTMGADSEHVQPYQFTSLTQGMEPKQVTSDTFIPPSRIQEQVNSLASTTEQMQQLVKSKYESTQVQKNIEAQNNYNESYQKVQKLTRNVDQNAQSFQVNDVQGEQVASNVKNTMGQQIKSVFSNEIDPSNSTNGLKGIQTTITAEPFYPTTQTDQEKHKLELQKQYKHASQAPIMMSQHMGQVAPQQSNQQGKKLGDLINHHQRQPKNIKPPAIQVLPIPIFPGLNNKPPKQSKHQKNNQINHVIGEKNQQENQNFEFGDYNMGMMKQNDQQYHQQIITTFYDSSIMSKKMELDQKMKQTTEKLNQKIKISKEINQEYDEEDAEEDDITFDVLSTHDGQNDLRSIERADSVLNKSLTIKEIAQNQTKVKIDLKNQKSELVEKLVDQQTQAIAPKSAMAKQEDKDKFNQAENKVKKKNQRQAIFKKLQEQIEQFKNEMFAMSDLANDNQGTLPQNNRSSISPRRSKTMIKGEEQSKDLDKQKQFETKQIKEQKNQNVSQPKLVPFRQNLKQYLEKVLDLMNMINEVDDVTNVADLKNKIERYKNFIMKARVERDQQSRLVVELQQQLEQQNFINSDLKEKEIKYQNQISDNQTLIQTLNQNLQSMEETNKHNCHLLSMQQQVEQTLSQEKDHLLHENIQIKKNIDECAQMHQHQLNQLRQDNEQLQALNYNQQNHIQQLLQQQIDNKMIQSKLDKMEGDRILLENQLKEYQKTINKPNTHDEVSFRAESSSNQRGAPPLAQSVESRDQQLGPGQIQNGVILSPKKQPKHSQKINQTDGQNSDDSDEVPLETQLQNANQQIKDLQDYIKKKRVNDLQNKQPNAAHNAEIKSLNEKYAKLKKQFEDMEKDKDKIIMRLKDFIKNHNESILIGSLGSSMVGTGNIVYSSNVGGSSGDTRSERVGYNQSTNNGGGGMHGAVDDQSTIEARSQIDNSIDNYENEDIVRAIMNDYTCEKCEEKDRIIENNEQRIADYISYIKKNTKHANQKHDPTQVTSQVVDGGRGNQTINVRMTNCISTQTENKISGGQQQSQSVNMIGTRGDTINISQSSQGVGGPPSSGAVGNSKDSGQFASNSSLLRASHQILLNNYLRQVKIYLDNVQEQESESIERLKGRLDQVANQQRITLFDEDDGPDADLITPDLIQKIVQMSMDLINDLITAQKNFSTESAIILDQQQPQIVEKIVEKVVMQFKTIDFGITPPELKEMQKLAREERKACHHIIVEIEKLMYEMNTLMAQSPMQFNHAGASQVFAQILDTYLKLPHRLKPIFDHCKKIETVMQKAMKAQDEAIKKAHKDQQTQQQSQVPGQQTKQIVQSTAQIQ